MVVILAMTIGTNAHVNAKISGLISLLEAKDPAKTEIPAELNQLNEYDPKELKSSKRGSNHGDRIKTLETEVMKHHTSIIIHE